MKKTIIAIMALVAMCTSVNAQNANSLYIGVSPFGGESIKLKNKDNNTEFNYKYKSYFNASIAKEGQAFGFGHLIELAYSKAKFDEVEIKNSSKILPFAGEDIYSIGGALYGGQSLNSGHRFQVPIYGGFGADYINGGPFHHVTVFLGFKLRLKYYFTEKFGIYAGGAYKLGLGKSSEKGDLTPQSYFCDAGIVISLN